MQLQPESITGTKRHQTHRTAPKSPEIIPNDVHAAFGNGDPPPKRQTATPVASRGSGAKQNNDVNIKAYTPVSLLDKWRVQQAIFRDRNLSPTAKVVAGVLLDCLNCRTGKCCPSLAYLAGRIGRKRRVISAALAQLSKHGWLGRRGRRGSSVYCFAFDRLQQHGVQETASHEPEGVRKTAYPVAQDSAHEHARETALLNTENVESDNGNWEVIPPGANHRTRPAKPNPKQPKRRKTCVPEDWQPSENDVAFAAQCGLGEQAIAREAIKFKNYYIGNGTVRLYWDRVWQNWCIRAVEYADTRSTNNAQSRRSLVAGLLHTTSDSRGQS